MQKAGDTQGTLRSNALSEMLAAFAFSIESPRSKEQTSIFSKFFLA